MRVNINKCEKIIIALYFTKITIMGTWTFIIPLFVEFIRGAGSFK